MIQKLSSGEPFLETRYIEWEADCAVSGRCLLLNLDSEQSVPTEGGFELPPLQVCEVRELHVQVAGDGAVDLLRSADPADVFVSLPLAAGSVHVATWNARGEYPWHRYRSKSRCIFLAVSVEAQ